MKRYVSLLRFTEQGAKGLKQSTTRAHAFAEAARKAGVTIEEQLWLMGGYDGILVIAAETEERALHWLTELASAGNVRTETMQAFGESEFSRIVSG